MGEIIFLLILSVAGLKFNKAFALNLPSLGAEIAEARIPSIVNEAIVGPLRGKTITLVLPEGQNENFLSDEIFREVASAVYLMRLPRAIPPNIEEYIKDPNNTNKRHTDVQYLNNKGESVNFPKSTGVVVVVAPQEKNPWWPLRYPPFRWFSNVVLVVSPTSSCWRTPLLQMPLLHITTWVAIICPSIPQGKRQSNLSFKVWTWLPFAATERLVDLGPWNPGSFHSWDQLFVDRFYDMSENTVTIMGNPVDWPFFYEKTNGDYAGQTLWIAEFTARRLNSKVIVRGEKDSSYLVTENLIKEGEVDAMLNFATPSPDRYRDFQLSIPYAFESFGLVLEEPPPLPQWRNVIYPFSWTVWGYTVGAVIATSVTFHILYYKFEKSFITNTITISQSILSNALAVVPDGWNIRWFLLMWWLTGWLLNLSYTCNLIAILTVPVFPRRIHSLEVLADTDYRLCMLDYGEFVQDELLASPQKKFTTLGKKMDMVPIREDLPEVGEEACIERVVAGTHAHVEAMPLLELLYEKLGHGSTTYVMEERLYPAFLIIVVHKYDPWKYKLDIDIQRLLESGIASKWYDEIMDEHLGPKFKRGSAIKQKALALGHLQGPFLLYVVGLFLGLLSMASEVLFPPSR